MGKSIFSEAQRNEMWKSQTILRVSKFEREYDNTHFKTYALGWRKEDMHGYEVISHTGTLSGFQAYVVLVPELGPRHKPSLIMAPITARAQP